MTVLEVHERLVSPIIERIIGNQIHSRTLSVLRDLATQAGVKDAERIVGRHV